MSDFKEIGDAPDAKRYTREEAMELLCKVDDLKLPPEYERIMMRLTGAQADSLFNGPVN